MAKQRYVSSELTHFVGSHKKTDEERYQLLVHVLKTGTLKHPDMPDGSMWNLQINCQGNISQEEVYRTTVVCFCDIPVDDLDIHMAKYGRFGVAFPKEFMLRHGANPVYYVGLDFTFGKEDAGPVGKPAFDQNPYTWDEAVRDYHRIMSRLPDLVKLRPDMPSSVSLSRFLNLMDFRVLSYIKPFDLHKCEDDHAENYYMEREWRIVGSLRFAIDDVRRVILPKQFVDRFRQENGLVGQCGEIQPV